MEKYLVLDDFSGKLVWSTEPDGAMYKRIGPVRGEPLIINRKDFNEILEDERARLHGQINIMFTFERMGFYDCKFYMGWMDTLKM